ncbi:MAG: HAD-IIIA family hydrolase [candidate division WOR-3 bacterium]|nr:HAD-IIIA family hydrolase [candidate division WOR-3 bacterium]MCX7946986.1 HAD-IIIA family hydrolase [candidate division WOR-3 bacterium]MDW8149973.1 HAD-IIIA family hydrolase [candidate division WOR-3 bacterium]
MNLLIFDRDGTIIENSHYPGYPWQIKLKKGIKEKLMKYSKEYKFFIISNQSGIKRGYFSLNHLNTIQRYIDLMLYPIKFERVYYCTHHPNENCSCRKPKNYFLRKILYSYNFNKCYVVGDRESDELLAKSLNIRFIHINEFLLLPNLP